MWMYGGNGEFLVLVVFILILLVRKEWYILFLVGKL